MEDTPTIYMRHKGNGEVREVAPDSEEFYGLRSQVLSNGQSAWEQTNLPHARSIRDRAAVGELLDEDLGHEDQDELRPLALKLDDQGVTPEKNPHLMLSPGEVEAGMTPQSKLQELREQFEQGLTKARHGIFNRAAERIHGDGPERLDPLEHAGGQGMMARAGGSDDRENVPYPDARNQGTVSADGVDDSGEMHPDASASGQTPAVAGSSATPISEDDSEE